MKRLSWAGNLFGHKAVATACLGADCAVMLHLMAQASPEARVFMVAPGDLSSEALEAVAEIRNKMGLEVTLLDPTAPPSQIQSGRNSSLDSGEALSHALEDAFCWISDSRADQPLTHPQGAVLTRLEDGLYQLNPLFDWSQAEVEAYRAQHDLPRPAHGGWRAAAQGQQAFVARHAG